MKKPRPWKLYLLGVVALLVLIMALQNTQPVTLELLFVTVFPPLVLLILFCLAFGFALGWLVSGRRVKKKHTNPKATPADDESNELSSDV